MDLFWTPDFSYRCVEFGKGGGSTTTTASTGCDVEVGVRGSPRYSLRGSHSPVFAWKGTSIIDFESLKAVLVVALLAC